MSSSETGSRAVLHSTPSSWIISPAADLLLLIATPLVIVPVMLFVAWRHFTIEQISLVVVAFASIGHQLPGFLRAYSDSALFARYRWRMLLGPPIALAAAWLIALTQLHGLILLLLLWSTWHVLMQTYGMLRIYDLKRGLASQRRARVDFWTCMALFVWGFVCSESRLLMLAETAWRIGLPMLTPEGAEVLRWGSTLAAVGMLSCYLFRLGSDYRSGQFVWLKPILLVSTGWLYWLCGLAAIPILLGIAMFEVFHAIQYDALVWAYDRNLGKKIGSRLGPLRRFCEQRGSFLWLYLAAIVAFGAVRLLADAIDEPRTQTLLLAAITASTLMHFYFDGFIWKVSAPQRTESPESASSERTWGSAHFWKCAGLGLVVGGLLLLEARGTRPAGDEARWLANAAQWAPNLPELQQRWCRSQLAQGDTSGALQTARRVVALAPESSEAHADLGAILLRLQQYPEAIVEYDAAIRLAPERWQNQFDLGLAQTQLANWSGAELAFAAADRVFPESTQIQRGWADLELARGDAMAAALRLQKQIAVRSLGTAKSEENPNDAVADAELNRHWISALSAAGQHEMAVESAKLGTRVENASSADWLALGRSLNAAGRFEQAVPPLNAAIRLQAHDAEARYQLGLSQMQLGDVVESRRQLRLALEENPQHALAWFQQANLAYAEGDLETAAKYYRQSLALKPRLAAAHSNLGAVLFAQNNFPAAVVAYRRALELSPNNPQSHYNLGLLLLLQDDLSGARLEILRAAELGQPCSAEVAAKLGLDR